MLSPLLRRLDDEVDVAAGGGTGGTSGAAGAGGAAQLEVPPLLHARAAALEALVTTLRRARTEKARPKQESKRAHPDSEPGKQPPPPQPPAEDAFSVFDF